MNMQQGQDPQGSSQHPTPPQNPSHEQISQHTLSNQLRELAEEEGKSALITDHPQRTLENASRTEQDSISNPFLANSELIQVPLQQYTQQQPLRLSMPAPNNYQTSIVQSYTQVGQIPQGNLRATLPATGQTSAFNSQVVNQPQGQTFSGWINQPSTTQARIQTNVRDFPTQSPPPQFQSRGQINTLNIVQPNQPRPSSTSPQKITFNYTPSQKNINPNPQPQPQPQPIPRPPNQLQPNPQPISPQPQPQPLIIPPKPQPQPIVVPVQPQPIIVNPLPPQPQPPRPIDNNPQFILPAQNQQVIFWQQRYFILVQKFQYYYTRIEIIHKKCIYLNQAISQTKKTEELTLLRAEADQLLSLITSTEQELIETIHRNRQLITESTNWKQKYDQLVKAFQALKQLHTANIQELTGKIQILSQQLNQMENNYHAAVKKGEEEAARNHQLEHEIVQLNAQLKNIAEKPKDQFHQYEAQLKELTKLIQEKDHIISTKDKIIFSLQQSLQKPDNRPQPLEPSPIDTYQKEIHRLEGELLASKKTISQLEQSYKLKQSDYLKTISQQEKKIIQHQTIVQNYQRSIKQHLTTIESKNKEIIFITKQYESNSTQNPSSRSSEFQIQNRRLKHELSLYEESHNSDIKIFNGKIQELLDKVKMISNERDAAIATLQQKVNLLESDINRKDGTIRNLRDRILQLEEEKKIRDLDRKYEPRQDNAASQQLSQQVANLRREISDKNNDIEQLEAQLTEYKRITNQYEDSLKVKKHQVNTLKRELQEKTQGVSDSTHLSEQLAKKNAELIELKSKLVEQERIANLNQVLKQENAHLTQSLRKKHSELTQAVDKAYFLEKQLREVEVSAGSAKVQQVSQEIELLQAANNRKDQEIIKLRQSNQLLQTNCDELQLELERLKGRLTAGERNLETQRTELKAKVSALQLKVVQLQRKASGLEQVRTIMTEQVNTLTAEIHIKYENQQRLEVQLKQERARGKAFEAEIQAQMLETEEARVKVREWERKFQTLSKELQSEIERKKDLSNTKKNEMYNLNNKYLELEGTLKARQARIKQLEKTNDSLSAKIRTFDHNLQEIQYLKHKIAEYQHKISYQTFKFAPRLPDLEPTQVFERKVIYQLKIENEALRRQLGLVPNTDTKDIPERDTTNTHVNQRLNDFNKKLEEVISQHMVVDYNLTGDELYRRMQRDRRLLIQKHNEEIAQLKMRILELQGHNTTPTLPKKYNNINQIFNEQLEFYREKNLELQQRVQSHIKVNRQLKESIQVLLKTHSGESSLAYYREQLDKANETIVNLQKQLKKGNEELKKLKEDASRAASRQIAQSNVTETENKVVELTRKLNQLTQEISLLEKDRATKEETIGRGEAQSRRLKNALEELRLSRDQLQRALKEKEINYQDEVAKLTNKLRINQMEIQRLNQIISKRQETESTQAKSLKARAIQLQEENKKLRIRVQELIISEEKYQRELSKLENRILILTAESQRLKETAEGAGKKNREGDAELQGLRTTINEYQVKIKSFESLREGFTYRENQLQQEVTRLNNQAKLLQSQVERINEFTQRKLSEKETEISRFKALLNEKIDYSSKLEDQIREMKVLSFKSNETAQEIFTLKEQINNLKVTLNIKATQSQNRLKEVYELNDRLRLSEEQSIQVKRSWEAKILELQSVINSLQGQLSDARRAKDSSAESNNKVVILQQQLRVLRVQKDQEIVAIRTKLEQQRSTYELQLSQLRSTNYSLRQQIDELTINSQSISQKYRLISMEYQELIVQIHKHEETITRLNIQITYLKQHQASSSNNSSAELLLGSKYTVEYLRSVLIQVEVLLSEQGSVRYQVLQRVQKQLESGLTECQHWNQHFSV